MTDDKLTNEMVRLNWLSIPNACPACGADLTDDCAVEERDLLPVTYSGRVIDGQYQNDGSGYEWFDQDGGDASLWCVECDEMLSPPDRVRVKRDRVPEELRHEP